MFIRLVFSNSLIDYHFYTAVLKYVESRNGYCYNPNKIFCDLNYVNRHYYVADLFSVLTVTIQNPCNICLIKQFFLSANVIRELMGRMYTRPESRAGYPVCTANVLGESISLNVDKTENSCRGSSLLSNQDSRFTWVPPIVIVFIPMSKEISADSHMALLFSVILTRVDLTITNQKVYPYWNRVESFWWIKCSIWIKILWNFHSVIFCRQTWFEIWFGLQPFL